MSPPIQRFRVTVILPIAAGATAAGTSAAKAAKAAAAVISTIATTASATTAKTAAHEHAQQEADESGAACARQKGEQEDQPYSKMISLPRLM